MPSRPLDAEASSPTHTLSDPLEWPDRHGAALYRFAHTRLRDSARAEDVVQETLLSALRARDGFRGQSSERTWLMAILRRKIVDEIRRLHRERPAADALSGAADADEFGPDPLDAFFDGNGHWRAAADTTGEVSAPLETAELRAGVRRCIAALPTRLAEALTLREIDGLSTDEVCSALGVTATNLWVMLHRARSRLWKCLRPLWVGRSASADPTQKGAEP